MKTRQCTKCNQELPLDKEHFVQDKRNGSYAYWCRKCRNRYEQVRYHRVQAQAYSPQVSQRAISQWVQSYKEGKV